MNTPGHQGAWPLDIAYDAAAKILKVSFDDGKVFDLPAEYLRVESPSAEVQGHHPSERKFVPGCRHVGISAIEPVGNYAIRLTFDDRHDTGLYSWALLHELGREHAERWPRYLEGLAARNLSREPG
jgi:DUF971 family protein